jgi:hypothetical protein
MSYGTVMIGKVKPGSVDEVRDAGRRWLAERAPVVRGFEDEWVMLGDDGTVVMAVRFASKEDYAALAEDPAQDAFWSKHMVPVLQEVQWVDGTWEPLIQPAKGG